MESPETAAEVGAQPEYYYDLSSGSMLLGRAAVESYIESGGHPADIIGLGTVLRDTDIELPIKSRGIDTDDWQRQDYINYGRWLVNIINPPTDRKSKTLNERILARARDLGIGPNPYRLIKTAGFKHTVNFYHELGLENAQLRRDNHAFDDWDDAKYGDYLRSIGAKIGRRPSREDIRSESMDDPTRPSEYHISTRFGSFGKAMEAAGYTVVANWEEQDYIDWGVRFMQANNGYRPTQSAVDYLSKLDLGPSATTISNHFGSLREFQAKVEESHQLNANEAGEQTADTVNELQAWISEDKLPLEVLRGSRTPTEIVRRFALYKVLNSLLPHNLVTAKVTMSKKTELTELIKDLRVHKPSISMEQLRDAIKDCGYERILFAEENERVAALKLPDEFASARKHFIKTQ